MRFEFRRLTGPGGPGPWHWCRNCPDLPGLLPDGAGEVQRVFLEPGDLPGGRLCRSCLRRTDGELCAVIAVRTCDRQPDLEGTKGNAAGPGGRD